jgi:hypothetical protein
MKSRSRLPHIFAEKESIRLDASRRPFTVNR